MTPNTPAGGAVAWDPCPFCGCDHADNATNAPFPSRAFGARYWTARCGNPSCGADVEGETEQDALNRWNRRPATVSVEAVLALVALWRNRAARKRECGLTKGAEIDEARADELESLTRGEK